MGDRFTVTVDAKGKHSAAPIIRLRQWLKLGLRGFGLRCVDVRQHNAPDDVERASVAASGVASHQQPPATGGS